MTCDAPLVTWKPVGWRSDVISGATAPVGAGVSSLAALYCCPKAEHANANRPTVVKPAVRNIEGLIAGGAIDLAGIQSV
jgi:hypothetical protein